MRTGPNADPAFEKVCGEQGREKAEKVAEPGTVVGNRKNPYSGHGGGETVGAADWRSRQAQGVDLHSLKRSRGESPLLPNKHEPSKGMSIKLAWTSPEKPVKRQWLGSENLGCPAHTLW